MDKSHLIDTVYTPIFKEIEAKGVFRTEKQKQRWWDLVNSGLNHTVREFSQLKNSQILAGLEVLSDSCCKECRSLNGTIFRSADSIPVIPFTSCSWMKSGKSCNCCFLPVVD